MNKHNVDFCTRLLEKSFTLNDICDVIYAIENIPNENRVSLLRNKSGNDIKNIIVDMKMFLDRIISNLASRYGHRIMSEDTNNRNGADLYTIIDNKKYNIELKFGHKTDRALGMKALMNLLDFDGFKNALSLSIRKQWRNLIENEADNFFSQEKRLKNTLNEAIIQFNNNFSNYILNQSEQDYLVNNIINNSGTPEKSCENYIKVSFADGEFQQINIVPNIGQWVVDNIELLSDMNRRVKIVIRNEMIKKRVEFLLNWKNNYHKRETDYFIPSKYGLTCPSWNVWVIDEN